METAGFANPSFPTLWTPPFPTLGNRCGGLIRLPRAWGNIGFRCPVRVDYRHFDVRIGCFVFDPVSFAFQLVLFGLYRSFFIIGWKKDAVCLALSHVFGITADRDYCSNFARCKSISPNWLGRTILCKAFVRFRLLMIWYSIMLSAKEAIQPRLAQIPRKILAKTPRSRRHEQSIPPIMKNERPKTQQNLLKRKQYRPEHRQLHQIPNWGRATAPEFSYQYWYKPAAAKMPRRSGSPKGWKG